MHANTRQYTYFAFLLVDLSFVYIGPSWRIEVYMCALLQLCLTLCNPVDCSLPGSSVHGILQARYGFFNWNGSPCPPPGDLPDPGIKNESLMSPTLAGGFLFLFLPLAPPGKHTNIQICMCVNVCFYIYLQCCIK